MNLEIVIIWFCVNAFVTVYAENIQPQKEKINNADLEYLERISDMELNECLQMGLESAEKRNRYEQILLESQITVQNGSLSHTQLLETLPNQMAIIDSNIATKIVIAGQHFYQSKCAPAKVSGERCEFFLAQKSISVNTNLYEVCRQILVAKRNGHHRYRRLLPANYYDGFYEMYPEEQLPSPRSISINFVKENTSNLIDDFFDKNLNNLALVQWAQFIEHDVSKSVATSMSNGSPIECCNKNSFKQQPRYQHPACAPILEKNINNKLGKQICLNYVRSAIAVGSRCNFGAAGQLNQATGIFDLSQLYGYTKEAIDGVRLFTNGFLNHSISTGLHQSLLALVENAKQTFCAFKTNDNHDNCFTAGDSRVNNSPLTILIYTLFLRNHNQIAKSLHLRHPHWTDEKLFQVAKSINIDIYRRIIFDEWLPNVIDLESVISIMKNAKNYSELTKTDFEISNEFAVAAIRFYYSMIPSHIQNFNNGNKPVTQNNNFKTEVNIFDYKDEMFKPKIMYSSSKLNDILDSILQQRAKRMDAIYEENVIPHRFHGIRPSHADILAFDIQRGRDHGIRGYVAYLELCTGTKINDWRDLETFMPNENLIKLKNQYHSLNEIDLIIGGISEHPLNYSVVGPTFNCILGEQFIKIHEWQTHMEKDNNLKEELKYYENVTAVDFLCSNSVLRFVPRNIFKIASTRNALVSCEDHVSIIRN